MAAQRQLRPEPERPNLRIVARSADVAAGPEVVGAAFHHGLRWGIVLSTLGFWLPVGAALYAWLGRSS